MPSRATREDPCEPAGDVEEFLIEQHAADIRADILQVGHHGSKTSSRHALPRRRCKPHLALVSSGPEALRQGRRCPIAEVIDELKAIGATVLRTDEHDDECPVAHRIGGD